MLYDQFSNCTFYKLPDIDLLLFGENHKNCTSYDDMFSVLDSYISESGKTILFQVETTESTSSPHRVAKLYNAEDKLIKNNLVYYKDRSCMNKISHFLYFINIMGNYRKNYSLPDEHYVFMFREYRSFIKFHRKYITDTNFLNRFDVCIMDYRFALRDKANSMLFQKDKKYELFCKNFYDSFPFKVTKQSPQYEIFNDLGLLLEEEIKTGKVKTIFYSYLDSIEIPDISLKFFHAWYSISAKRENTYSYFYDILNFVKILYFGFPKYRKKPIEGVKSYETIIMHMGLTHILMIKLFIYFLNSHHTAEEIYNITELFINMNDLSYGAEKSTNLIESMNWPDDLANSLEKIEKDKTHFIYEDIILPATKKGLNFGEVLQKFADFNNASDLLYKNYTYLDLAEKLQLSYKTIDRIRFLLEFDKKSMESNKLISLFRAPVKNIENADLYKIVYNDEIETGNYILKNDLEKAGYDLVLDDLPAEEKYGGFSGTNLLYAETSIALKETAIDDLMLRYVNSLGFVGKKINSEFPRAFPMPISVGGNNPQFEAIIILLLIVFIFLIFYEKKSILQDYAIFIRNSFIKRHAK